MNPEIPKLECKGCQARDEINRRLAEKVDEQAKQIELLTGTIAETETRAAA